jgi:uroporphyrinogen-III synthase
MRLLVTRPQPEASETAAALRALGHTVLVQPMLSIVSAPAPERLTRPAAIALTSRNGLRALCAWPQASAWRDVPVLAVGAATAAAAQAAGFADVRAGDGGVEGLARLIAAAEPRGMVLHPAARQPAGDLAGALGAAGIALVAVEAYAAEPATTLLPEVREALGKGRLDGALFYSERTAAAFAALIRAAGLRLSGVTCFALSPAVAAPLAGLGAARIVIAAKPEGAALIALLPPAA